MDLRQLDRLRTLTALVHSSPGATLHLECASGATVVAGAHGSADLSPCQLRRVVSAAAHPAGFGVVEHITAMSVGGSLEQVGPGMFDDRSGEWPTTRIASLLGPAAVESALSSVTLDGAHGDRLDARVSADVVLGVSCVAISGDGGDSPRVLEHVAVAAAAAILIRECELIPRAGSRAGFGPSDAS